MREFFQRPLNGANLRQILPDSQFPYRFGTSSSDEFTANSWQESYFGGTGSDTINYENSPGRVSVDLTRGQGVGGSAHNDTYDSIENIVGSDFGDALTGNNASNMLHGRGGNDTFGGSKGNDQLFGGEGDYDTVIYSNNDKGIDADLSAQKVNKGFGNGIDRIDGIENVVGSNFDDKLTGDEKDNVLSGLDGNDTFVGSTGNDRLIGGEGDHDTVDYRRNDQSISANLARSTVIKGEGNGTDTISGIENVIGSNFGDTLTGNTGNNTLDGHGGNDTFVGSKGDDTLIGGEGGDDTVDYSVNNIGIYADLVDGSVEKDGSGYGSDAISGIENIIGSQHGDRFRGDDQDNSFHGLGGNDTFEGSKGDDEFIGGDGRDAIRYNYSSLDQGVNVNLATNSVDKGIGNGEDFVSGIEIVVGTNFDDVIEGTEADEIFWGEGGDDVLSGGAGQDHIIGGAGNDVIDGGDGIDTAHFYFYDDNRIEQVSLSLQDGIVTTSTGEQDTLINIENVVIEGTGNATVEGDNSDNVIEMTELHYGNDTIDGRGGNDTMTGGFGADVFKFENVQPDESHGKDVITDFTVGVDKLDLSGTQVYGFGDLLNYDPSAPQSEWGDRYMVQEGDNVVIYTNNGAEGDSITLENVSIENLSTENFIF